MIRYSLHPFPLRRPSDQQTYQARVRSVGTLQAADIIDRMVARGLPGGRAAALAVIDVFYDTCQRALLEGYNLATPLFVTEISIRGTFDGPADQFRPNRHQLGFKAGPGPRLQQALRHDASVQKEEAHRPTAVVHGCTDLATNRTDALTLGGAVRLKGYDLKLGDAPDEYLALELPNGTEVRITRLFTNKPSELLFQMPEADLVAGQEVRPLLYRRPHNTATARAARGPRLLMVLAKP